MSLSPYVFTNLFEAAIFKFDTEIDTKARMEKQQTKHFRFMVTYSW